jgi:hypothetical protein
LFSVIDMTPVPLPSAKDKWPWHQLLVRIGRHRILYAAFRRLQEPQHKGHKLFIFCRADDLPLFTRHVKPDTVKKFPVQEYSALNIMVLSETANERQVTWNAGLIAPSVHGFELSLAMLTAILEEKGYIERNPGSDTWRQVVGLVDDARPTGVPRKDTSSSTSTMNLLVFPQASREQ